ncbi:hypothetical protein D3C72_2215080 [compost metagenome]
MRACALGAPDAPFVSLWTFPCPLDVRFEGTGRRSIRCVRQPRTGAGGPACVCVLKYRYAFIEHLFIFVQARFNKRWSGRLRASLGHRGQRRSCLIVRDNPDLRLIRQLYITA